MVDAEKFGEAMGVLIREAVAPLHERIAELEARELVVPKHGMDGADGKDGAPGEPGADGSPGKQGEPGKDGLDGKSVTVDDVAPVLEMAVSKWALEFERRAQDTIQKAIDRIPVPKDGKDGIAGQDGRDGLGFDDLEVEYDGIKTVTFKLQRGNVTKKFDLVMPVVTDCGIFKETQTYDNGDGVTWAGSYWIAQKDAPTGKPGETGSDGWRLAVKRGRDGKDGRDGIDKTLPVKL